MQRNPDYDYRIILTPRGWEVTSFFGNKAVGPVVFFPEGDLPDWIHKAIALLNLVDRNDSVPAIGHRVGAAYWLLTNTVPSNHTPFRNEKK